MLNAEIQIVQRSRPNGFITNKQIFSSPVFKAVFRFRNAENAIRKDLKGSVFNRPSCIRISATWRRKEETTPCNPESSCGERNERMLAKSSKHLARSTPPLLSSFSPALCSERTLRKKSGWGMAYSSMCIAPDTYLHH
jgi:hypothetical protein